MSKIEGKVVVITGASSGIGKALAYAFANEKCRLVLAARRIDKLTETRNDLEKKHASVISVSCDVTDEPQCKMLMDEAIKNYGTIDILICNAGISMRALFNDLKLEVIKQVMDVNFWGAVYCTKYALPYLLKNQGSVVAISSIAGKKGLPGRTGYSASKFALEGFMETLRTENLKNNLHVMVACPGFTASEIRTTALSADGSNQGESPRNESEMMQPDAVARLIIKGVEKRKRDLIMTTEGKLSVWLNKFFPALMDKVVFNHMRKEPDSPFK